MMKEKKTAFIISISSDIGIAMAQRWKACGWDVSGTYRLPSPEVDQLRGLDIKIFYCDLLDIQSIDSLPSICLTWDVLVMCPGILDPVCGFVNSNFNEWEQSLTVNFTHQMRILHGLLPFRRRDSHLGSCVLFFAGGGVNSAPVNSSAYTVSKIALIKMCELLDAEISDTRFVIVGPGWVDTKIHKTKPSGVDFTSMDKVLDCCDWVIDSPREIVGGRNFSVVSDEWGTRQLAETLIQQPDMYKLRRSGNF